MSRVNEWVVLVGGALAIIGATWALLDRAGRKFTHATQQIVTQQLEPIRRDLTEQLAPIKADLEAVKGDVEKVKGEVEFDHGWSLKDMVKRIAGVHGVADDPLGPPGPGG